MSIKVRMFYTAVLLPSNLAYTALKYYSELFFASRRVAGEGSYSYIMLNL